MFGLFSLTRFASSWSQKRAPRAPGARLVRHVCLSASPAHLQRILSKAERFEMFELRRFLAAFCAVMSFDPAGSKIGHLPPWEVAKAVAMDNVISDLEEHLGKDCWQLLGVGKVPYVSAGCTGHGLQSSGLRVGGHEVQHIEEQFGQQPYACLFETVGRLFVASSCSRAGGGHPSDRAVRKLLSKCKCDDWFPGKAPDYSGGRPAVFSEHVKDEVARVAMRDKQHLVRPTPARCRGHLPRKTINKGTGLPMSGRTAQRIFEARCYDEDGDDPWQWLGSAAQEYLPEGMRPLRVSFATTFLAMFKPVAWYWFVAIDPCRSLLPKNSVKSEEQRHAALGKMGWRSKKSFRNPINAAKVQTANTQASGSLSVPWMPVFARGKVKIYMCGLEDAQEKLTTSEDSAKFVLNVLPGVLSEMKAQFGWTTTPTVLVHDKASNFVSPKNCRLQSEFALALLRVGLRSWVGDAAADTTWLAPCLGDFYPRETLISHIRRCLNEKFPFKGVGETRAQFRRRLDKVEDYLNSDGFGDFPGSLLRLGKAYHARSGDLTAHEGRRLPK